MDLSLKSFLDEKADQYNQPGFISSDPICIPHLFSIKQDIEIMGLFAAVFAWGQRTTIIQKCRELIERMGGRPYDFVMHHSGKDLKRLTGFKHRTFNDTDLLYFIHFLHRWYSGHDSLEKAFDAGSGDMEARLNCFRQVFFSDENAPARTSKHIASPAQHSACKRLNMFLRWMVRKDSHGVDFGLWDSIPMSSLICPLDLHVQRVALRLGLLKREQGDWKAATELTDVLRLFDASDPVRYDFALFGLGIEEKYQR